MSAAFAAIAPRTPAQAAAANNYVVMPLELDALWHESNAATVVGIAAITARLLNQIDGHIAERPTTLDVTGAVVGVVGKTIQPTLDTLTNGLAAVRQQLVGQAGQLSADAGKIAALQQATSQASIDAKNLTTRVSHSEEHLAANDAQFVAVGSQIAGLQHTTTHLGNETRSLVARLGQTDDQLASHGRRLVVEDARITGLQQSAEVLRADTQTILTRLVHVEEHLRRLQEHQDMLQRGHRELREELLSLVEVEFRAPLQALAERQSVFEEHLTKIAAAQHDKAHDRKEAAAAVESRPTRNPR